MKRYLNFLGLILLSNTCLFAQNVGIGDPLPSAKLTISGSETTTNGQAATLKIINTASSNAWYLRAGAAGTLTPANGFSIGDNLSNHFNLLSNGNLGLGLIPLSARLHVNGPIKIEGANVFEFGAGIIGKELNAGKIGYNSFGSNALEIIGAGTSSSNRRVYFFAEGGTTFSGSVGINQNLNTNGQLQLNGNPGIDGQVLTSNGGSAPTWQNQAFSNNVRFAVRLGQNNVTPSGDCRIPSTEYNLSPADISIGTSSITINKTGLYHFDIELHGVLYYGSSSNVNYPLFGLTFYCGPVNPYSIVNNRVMSPIGSSNATWVCDGSGSIDMYITAPTTLRVAHALGALGTPAISSYGAEGYLVGYLIKE